MKKVTFGAKRPTRTATNSIDEWVENREVVPQMPVPRESMKRLTIDVPIPLHKRIKSRCAMDNLVMADVIRDLLEHRFPPQPTEREQGAAS
jgi:hypothetical protein